MNVAVLSRNPGLYSTQSLVLALRKRRHKVQVLDHMRCDLIVDSRNMEVRYDGYRLHDIEAIVPRIGASATQYGAAVIRHFEALGVPTTVPAEALMKSRDKLRCLQLLAGAGIDVPISAFTNNLSVLNSLLSRVGSMPVILKLLVSTQGLGVLKADDKQQANTMLEAFQRLQQDALIQEFISEVGGSDIRVFIVDGEIVASMERQAMPGEFRSNLHLGASSRPVVITEQEADFALRAVELIGLKVAGVDILRSRRGPLVLEVNASPGLEGIETTTGIDISSRIVACLERCVEAKYGAYGTE